MAYYFFSIFKKFLFLLKILQIRLWFVWDKKTSTVSSFAWFIFALYGTTQWNRVCGMLPDEIPSVSGRHHAYGTAHPTRCLSVWNLWLHGDETTFFGASPTNTFTWWSKTVGLWSLSASFLLEGGPTNTPDLTSACQPTEALCLSCLW